jgi:hypothetical protein
MSITQVCPQGTIFSGRDAAIDRALEGSNVCFGSLHNDVEAALKKCCETDEAQIINSTEGLPCWVAVNCRSPVDAEEASQDVQVVRACVREEKESDESGISCIVRTNFGAEEEGGDEKQEGEAQKVGERLGVTMALAGLAAWVIAVGLC